MYTGQFSYFQLQLLLFLAMTIERTNQLDQGLFLMQTNDNRNADPRVHMIRTVQHLIERCLLFRMELNDCVETLAKHAKIHPALTIAVWKGLLKENGDFFRDYFKNNSRLYNPPAAAGTTDKSGG